MQNQVVWAILIFILIILYIIKTKMKKGFGPINLRVLGIVTVAFLSSLMSIYHPETMNAAMSILGAIAGYLFATKDNQNINSSFGDHAKVAGRDINETINNIEAKLESLENLAFRDSKEIDKLLLSQEIDEKKRYDYLLNTIYRKKLSDIKSDMSIIVNEWEQAGWHLMGVTSDFTGIDGIILVFKRPSTSNNSKIEIYHSADMVKVV